MQGQEWRAGLALSQIMATFRPFAALLLLGFACLAGSLTARAAARPAYVGAIIVDADSGEVLFEDKADVISPPASMTKLMTFAVVHDRIASGALKVDQLTSHVVRPERAEEMYRMMLGGGDGWVSIFFAWV